jgi:AcrR family transcriptional regulator
VDGEGIPGGRRGPGRPRSDRAGPALLAAARELVTRYGYEAVSIADIAQAAGTGRQTIYRRWPGKAELVLDAFTEHAVSLVDTESPETDGPAGAGGTAGTGGGSAGTVGAGGAGEAAGPGGVVREFLERTFAALTETGPALRSLMAQAQHDPAFCAKFRERFIGPRRAALRVVLARAQQRGLVGAGVDLDAAVAALYGGLWYRLLLDEPLDPAYAASLASLVTDPES